MSEHFLSPKLFFRDLFINFISGLAGGALVGIFEKGKRGSDSPVLVIGKNEVYTSPFDAFKNNFNRMWMNAKKIDEV